MPDPQKKIYELDEAREKIRAFCDYRERSQVEAREKLFSYGLIPEVVDELLVELIQQDFLSEERFARAYVRGKFRIKKWGRQKIRTGLHRHGLSAYVLNKAFAEIDDKAYEETLDELLQAKYRDTRETNVFRKKGRVARWLISRGYEPDIVWDKLRELDS